MYNEDTELIFPNRVIPELADLRGVTWKRLVEEVAETAPDSEEQLAFVLMMAKIDGCMTCNADSFRAMKGCTLCAQDAIRRFRDKDADLIKLYKAAQEDVSSLQGSHD